MGRPLHVITSACTRAIDNADSIPIGSEASVGPMPAQGGPPHGPHLLKKRSSVHSYRPDPAMRRITSQNGGRCPSYLAPPQSEYAPLSQPALAQPPAA